MNNNTLISIVFVVGTIMIVILRLIINRSMYNYKGDQNNKAEEFNSNTALTINSLLTFVMFLAILLYDGCTKDLETKYKQEFKSKYENFEKYIEEERLKGKEDALEEIRDNLNTNNTQ